jgi:transcription initiation factor IIF auxiliary subunit
MAFRLRIGGYCRCKGEGVAVALSIKQSQEYLGNDRWRWSVWLDGTPEELDAIDYVRYILHPTFHNPVRYVRDRTTNFRLETSGWGTFTMHAKVVHSDGHETSLDYDLVLLYPDGTPTFA